MLNVRVAWIVSLVPLSCFAAPPLDVIKIDPNYTSITLENGTTIYSLQNALDSTYTSENDTVTLFPNACLQNDGTPNCTAACQHNAQMFSSLETLHNCAVFQEISANLANRSLTPNARVLAEELGISSVPSNISSAIQSCLHDSCTLDQQCNRTLYGRNSHPTNFTGTQFINICKPITAYVNADVGGIGVWSQLVLSSMSINRLARFSFLTLWRWG